MILTLNEEEASAANEADKRCPTSLGTGLEGQGSSGEASTGRLKTPLTSKQQQDLIFLILRLPF